MLHVCPPMTIPVFENFTNCQCEQNKKNAYIYIHQEVASSLSKTPTHCTKMKQLREAKKIYFKHYGKLKSNL